MNLLDMMKRLGRVGVAERAGLRNHPAIVWAHELCRMGEQVPDEIAWCSSIINLAAALLNAPRSRSAAARSWIDPTLGQLIVDPDIIKSMLKSGQLEPGWWVVVFKRGPGAGQSGPEVKKAPGHVAVFEEYFEGRVHVFGGNQSNAMSSASFPSESVIALLQLRAVA